MKTKNSIRSAYKSILKSLSKNDYIGCDYKLLDNFKQLCSWCNINLSFFKFAGYYPFNNEIDDLPILEYIVSCGGSVSLPVIKGDILDFLSFKEEGHLIKNNYGIYQPKEDESDRVYPDIILTPLVAFDNNGNRLGYGKGYYDKTISQMLRNNKKPCLIGVGYSVQKYNNLLPTNKWDIPLDAVITETNFQIFNYNSFVNISRK